MTRITQNNGSGSYVSASNLEQQNALAVSSKTEIELAKTNSLNTKSAIDSTANRSAPAKSIEAKSFVFKNTILLDWDNFIAEIKKSREFSYQPLCAELSADNPRPKEQFKTLFAAAIAEFSDIADDAALPEIQANGKLHQYAVKHKELLQPLNNFFGMLKALGTEKRKQGLNAFLTIPENDLNCALGMMNRIEFIKHALSAHSFPEFVYAGIEEKLVFGNSDIVGVHDANNIKLQLLNSPSPGEKNIIQRSFIASTEYFLEQGVTKFIHELVKIINSGLNIQDTVAAIQTCQEKYLPTLSFFFPPRESKALSEASSSASVLPTTQLHQHSDYFELDDDCMNYAEVNQENILRDALKNILPALSTVSKILILNKNPGLWDAVSPVFYPKLVDKNKSLSCKDFFRKSLFQELIPDLIERKQSILPLMTQGVVTSEDLLKEVKNGRSLMETLIEKNPESKDFETIYLQCTLAKKDSFIKTLEENPIIKQTIEPVKLLLTLIAAQSSEARTTSFENHEIALDIHMPPSLNEALPKIINATLKVNTAEIQELGWNKINAIFNHEFLLLDQSEKIEVVRFLDQFLSSNAIPENTNKAILTTLLSSIAPAKNQLERAMHCEIINMVGRQTDRMKYSRLGEHATDVLITLISTMGNLHAATLTGGMAHAFQGGLNKMQDPQTHAYKVVKRRLSQCAADPDNCLKLIQALWRGDTLENLSNATRTLSAAHWKKIITSVVGNTLLYAAAYAVPKAITAHRASVEAQYQTLTQMYGSFEQSQAAIREAAGQAIEVLNTIPAQSNLYNLIDDIHSGYAGVNTHGVTALHGTLQNFTTGTGTMLDDMLSRLTTIEASTLSPAQLAVFENLTSHTTATMNLFQHVTSEVRQYNFLRAQYVALLPISNWRELGISLRLAGKSVEAAYLFGIRGPEFLDMPFVKLRAIGRELQTWGPIGGIRTAVTLAKVMRDEPLASIQQAVVRLTPATLVNLRRTMLRGPTVFQARSMQTLNANWCTVLEKLNPPTHIGENENSDSNALPLIYRSQILAEYIKEFDTAHFPAVSPELLSIEKQKGLNTLRPEQLHELLPTLYKRSKLAYLELAEHLSDRETASLTLTQKQVDEIANNIQQINGATGKMKRLQIKMLAMKWRNKLLPAWLRCDVGFVDGWEARGRRTRTIKTARQDGVKAVVRKQERILASTAKLSQLGQPSIAEAESQAIDTLITDETASLLRRRQPRS